MFIFRRLISWHSHPELVAALRVATAIEILQVRWVFRVATLAEVLPIEFYMMS